MAKDERKRKLREAIHRELVKRGIILSHWDGKQWIDPGDPRHPQYPKETAPELVSGAIQPGTTTPGQ